MHNGSVSMLLLSMALAACTVGPDYQRPEPDLPQSFANADSTTTAELPSADALWASFDDPQLDALIDLALERNLSIAQSLAVLNETRALSGLQLYSWFPTVATSAQVERSKQSRVDPFAFPGQNEVEIYRAGFDASWEIDLFGTLRRQSERIRRRVEADEATLHAVQLAIVAEVAQTYFQWQGDTQRLTLLQESLASQNESVAILEASLEAGRGTSLDVARARSVMQQVAATIPLARSSRARAEQRLAVLTRSPVSELRREFDAHGRLPILPAMVPAGSPANWLMRRPDVLAAERRLADVTAGIGVETAELYPQLDLVGAFGWSGSSGSQLGDSNAERRRGVPTLTWRILDFGRIRQRILAAEAQTAGALAAYDEAWLLAIEETENALANYRATSDRVGALEQALAEGSKASDLAQLRYEAGADTYLSVLDADRSRIDLADQLVQARTDRATALAALYKAFGGDFTRVVRTSE